jgi:hypothetical protein
MDRISGKSCRRCGYDLTGLDFQGRCPECGCYHDALSGEGIGGGVMDRHRRGDRVVTLLWTVGLLLAAVVMVAVGLMVWLKTGRSGTLIATAAVSLLFLASSVVGGLSLLRR